MLICSFTIFPKLHSKYFLRALKKVFHCTLEKYLLR